VYAPHCLIELAFKFTEVENKLNGIGMLVGLAANMADRADELRVIVNLSIVARGFLAQLKYHQTVADDEALSLLLEHPRRREASR
jgi:hypothetical protein